LVGRLVVVVAEDLVLVMGDLVDQALEVVPLMILQNIQVVQELRVKEMLAV
jgi:hypothetical protein